MAETSSNPEAASIPAIRAVTSTSDVVPVNERSELLARARTFLVSPHIVAQDGPSKRRFLIEKGLLDSEIDGLLKELPPQIPTIPPRTYPTQPPSALPSLLLAIARLFTWTIGGSAALLLIYYRYLLPRVMHSTEARLSLVAHQKSLLKKLYSTASEVRKTQTETLKTLPPASAPQEDLRYTKCSSIQEVQAIEPDSKELPPPFTLLRITFSTSEGAEAGLPTETIFQSLENQLPWLKESEEGLAYQSELWKCLSTHPHFHAEPDMLSPDTKWSYAVPTAAPPAPLNSALTALRTTMGTLPTLDPNTFTPLLLAVSGLTGYITTQTYSLPLSMSSSSSSSRLAPELEEVKKEIRALKGLVLNRRSFMSTPARQM